MALFGGLSLVLNDQYCAYSTSVDDTHEWFCTENDKLLISITLSTGQAEDSNYYTINNGEPVYLPSGDTYLPILLSYGKIEIYWNNGSIKVTLNLTVNPLPSKTLQISTNTPEANIYYTTDNSTPTSNSNLYTNTFTANIGTTIKAIGIKEGYLDSDIAEFTVS